MIYEKGAPACPEQDGALLLYMKLSLCGMQAEGHEFALKAAIVEAALFIRAAAKAALKARMGGDG